MDGDNCRVDAMRTVISADLNKISQQLDSRNNYLVLEIKADRFETAFIEQFQDIIKRHGIATTDYQVCCDHAIGNWFLVFRLEPHCPTISFESLYFDLPDGVEFHFFHRSPVNSLKALTNDHLP